MKIHKILENAYVEQESIESEWMGAKINPLAPESRVIYGKATYDQDYQENKRIACGKYFWNPDGEDFEMFLVSVKEVADKIFPIKEEEDIAKQAYIFHLLMSMYMDPVDSLFKLKKEAYVDDDGRKVYVLFGDVGFFGDKEETAFMANLKKDELLMVSRLHHQRLVISTLDKRELGVLTFETAPFYYIALPLLKRKQAQMKLTVDKVEISEYQGKQKVSVKVKILLRLLDERLTKEEEYQKILDQLYSIQRS